MMDALPPEARIGYGPRVTALVGHLHGTYHLSDRAIGDLLANVADLPIGLGSVVTSTQRVSQALSPLDAAIHTAVHTAAVVHIDETSWREAGQRRWLWAPTTDQGASVRITTSRGRVGLDALLPATFDGIVESDRWNAYNRYPAAHRQICWAHLTRNIRARAEGGMRDSPWARDRLDHVESMFTALHAFRDGATTRAGLQTDMQPIQQAIHTTVEDGRTRTWYKVTALSQELLTWWDVLWTFVTHPGVEPTNNAAERVLRPAVIWRTQCFGAQSADGSCFVEWIFSVLTTCRQQGRNVWNRLTDAVRAP